MKLTDVTLPLTTDVISKAGSTEIKVFSGHVGTHFDVMNKIFPLEYVERKGFVFETEGLEGIDISDIDTDRVSEGMFVGFHTGFIEKAGYGTYEYHHQHPQLSQRLIEFLVERKVSIIGIDFAGARRGKEHSPCDQYCADHGVFIVENLCNLKDAVNKEVTVWTFPLNLKGSSGLPCRVVIRTEGD